MSDKIWKYIYIDETIIEPDPLDVGCTMIRTANTPEVKNVVTYGPDLDICFIHMDSKHHNLPDDAIVDSDSRLIKPEGSA